MAVTDEAIVKIKQMLLAGDLRPGDRLPPEKELSERLGLSRSSLREAVKALEVIRVLDVRRGDGTYVTSLEPRLLLAAIGFVTDLHQDGAILEMFAVRRILEPAAAALATQRAGAADVERLRELVSQTAPDAPVEDLIEHDVAFHRAVADLSGNGYLSGILEQLSSATLRARVWRGVLEAGAVTRTLDEHRGIVAAIAASDPALAHALATAHIAGVEQWLERAVARTPS